MERALSPGGYALRKDVRQRQRAFGNRYHAHTGRMDIRSTAMSKTVISKQDLIDAVASSCAMTKDHAKSAVDTMLEHIKAGMKKGEDVRIADFGTFKVTKRAAREGRNPSTGKAIQIPASIVPKFQPAKGLKDLLN